MPLYENRKNSENHISIDSKWRNTLVLGPDKVMSAILDCFEEVSEQKARAIVVAFDGWYGIDWTNLIGALLPAAAERGLTLEMHNIAEVFKSILVIEEYKKRYTTTDDPGFGYVNSEGQIEDLMDREKLLTLQAELTGYKKGNPHSVCIVYGSGAAVPALLNAYELIYYFDKTRQPILWEMWAGELVPFGYQEPKKDYTWKEYYYSDYYMLDYQKEWLIEHMDYWVEGISFPTLKMLPCQAYNAILQTLVQYPVKEVPIYQPGPWGAYRFKDLFEVPGLECNAWNELAGPELSILVDIGQEEMLNMPVTNLMQYNDQFLGAYINRTYPRLFPLDVWLDDGYFPTPTPAERISMPIHNHPSTEYVRRHFNEPLGRYETYYIAEAYEGANTWLGFKEDVDLEEWERLCRQSNNITEIPNWKDFISNVSTNQGDLILIPPGTTHGHGGNQMVLEMDTCPSIAATEYSFFMYDFARPSWDDTTKTMTGKKVHMHLEHGFDTEKWVRQNWVKEHLLAKPIVHKWTKEYQIDRYTSDARMPFEIERIHFEKRGEHDTGGKILHIVTLTVGNQVTLRSRKKPQFKTTLYKWQSALVPACMGEYELINDAEGLCTVVIHRWKKG